MNKKKLNGRNGNGIDKHKIGGTLKKKSEWTIPITVVVNEIDMKQDEDTNTFFIICDV